jgi:hypothetical protein
MINLEKSVNQQLSLSLVLMSAISQNKKFQKKNLNNLRTFDSLAKIFSIKLFYKMFMILKFVSSTRKVSS